MRVLHPLWLRLHDRCVNFVRVLPPPPRLCLELTRPKPSRDKLLAAAYSSYGPRGRLRRLHLQPDHGSARSRPIASLCCATFVFVRLSAFSMFVGFSCCSQDLGRPWFLTRAWPHWRPSFRKHSTIYLCIGCLHSPSLPLPRTISMFRPHLYPRPHHETLEQSGSSSAPPATASIQ